MTFKTDMAADADKILLNTKEFAEQMTSSVAGTIRVIPDYQSNLAAWELNGQATQALFLVLRAEYSQPARYETITQGDGTVWRVDQIVFHDNETWTLLVSTDRRIA